MTIKILTPEYLVFEGEVESLLVPGVSGDFHLFKDHAAVVSALKNGKVRIFTSELEEEYAKNFEQNPENNKEFTYKIQSGVIEYYHNNGIILCEE